MKKWMLRGFLAIALLAVIAFAALSYSLGSVKYAYGLLRYAVPRFSDGEVKVGDNAPDVELVSADGRSRLRLHDRIGTRPLVLIFGSYT